MIGEIGLKTTATSKAALWTGQGIPPLKHLNFHGKTVADASLSPDSVVFLNNHGCIESGGYFIRFFVLHFICSK